eukprot:6278200-Pyramimonas_sp.AAC.1
MRTASDACPADGRWCDQDGSGTGEDAAERVRRRGEERPPVGSTLLGGGGRPGGSGGSPRRRAGDPQGVRLPGPRDGRSASPGRAAGRAGGHEHSGCAPGRLGRLRHACRRPGRVGWWQLRHALGCGVAPGHAEGGARDLPRHARRGQQWSSGLAECSLHRVSHEWHVDRPVDDGDGDRFQAQNLPERRGADADPRHGRYARAVPPEAGFLRLRGAERRQSGCRSHAGSGPAWRADRHRSDLARAVGLQPQQAGTPTTGARRGGTPLEAQGRQGQRQGRQEGEEGQGGRCPPGGLTSLRCAAGRACAPLAPRRTAGVGADHAPGQGGVQGADG